jgi:hypothetical protein
VAQVENSITTNVGGFVPAITHVRAASGYGVINADPRLRRTRGEVCLLAPVAPVQGIALSTVMPVGTQLMAGTQFDKYRTGSHAIGVSG